MPHFGPSVPRPPRGAAVVVGSVLLTAAAAHAQPPRVLLKTGDQLPSFPADPTGVVQWVGNPTVCRGGIGFAAAVTTQAPVTGGTRTYSHVWGDTGDGPQVLRSEMDFGPLKQATLERRFGISKKGYIVYSAEIMNGHRFDDSVWLGDTPLAMQRDQVPDLSTPGYSALHELAGVTSDGTPYWLAGIADGPDGLTTRRGLFYGDPPEAILVPGNFVSGATEPLSPIDTVGPCYAFSAEGAHWIAQVTLSASDPKLSRAVALDAAIVNAGGLLRQGQAVGAPGAPASQFWRSFDRVGITEAGHYFVAGRTGPADPASATRTGVLLVDGVITHREGSAWDGVTLDGPVREVAMNENHDVAVIWNAKATPTSTAKASLFVNGARVLTVGDGVDMDGDGTVDSYQISALRGVDSLAVTDRSVEGTVTVYVIANLGGSQALVALTLTPGSPCRTDWDHNGFIEPADIAAFVTSWLADLAAGTLNADFDDNGFVEPADIASFTAAWMADLSNC